MALNCTGFIYSIKPVAEILSIGVTYVFELLFMLLYFWAAPPPRPPPQARCEWERGHTCSRVGFGNPTHLMTSHTRSEGLWIHDLWKTWNHRSQSQSEGGHSHLFPLWASHPHSHAVLYIFELNVVKTSFPPSLHIYCTDVNVLIIISHSEGKRRCIFARLFNSTAWRLDLY